METCIHMYILYTSYHTMNGGYSIKYLMTKWSNIFGFSMTVTDCVECEHEIGRSEQVVVVQHEGDSSSDVSTFHAVV